MLYTHLETFSSWAPDEPFLVTDWCVVSYREALEASRGLAAKIRFLGLDRFGVLLPNVPEQILLLLGAAAAGATVCVLDPQQSDAELQRQVDELGLDGLVVADDTRLATNAITYRELQETVATAGGSPARPGASRCIVLTQGRTGLSRGAEYLWEDLLAQGKGSDFEGKGRWLQGHSTSSFWGMLTLMRVLMKGDALLMPSSFDPSSLAQMAREQAATHIATTPARWQTMLPLCAELQLSAIELSGEAAHEELLTQSRERLPSTQLSQVYGTTELGICFTVADATEGFSAELLTHSEASAVRVREGLLEARTTHGMRNYSGERCDHRDRWQSTGDLVALRGDRYFFAGQARSRSMNRVAEAVV